MKVAGLSSQTGSGRRSATLAVSPCSFDSRPKRAPACRGQGVNKPEPGVVPGSGVFGAGVAEADDEAQIQPWRSVDRPAGPRGATRPKPLTSSSARPAAAAGAARLGGLGRRHFGHGIGRRRLFLDFDAGVARDDDRDVVLLAQLQLRQRDAFRQLEVATGGRCRRASSVGQVDLDELRQVAAAGS